nr:MobA/MobL family protein [Acinetobacter johnsonii]
MDDRPLLVLHIVQVKNWYAIFMEKNKTTQKTGVEFTKIYAPENTNTELLKRQTLWNEVEKVERRKDALLAREFEIAFPSELNAEQRENMLNELCRNLVKKYGVIVDAAIHAPHTDSGSDERNYHAHIMFTTRSINEQGGFSAKKYRTSVVTMAQKL